MADRYEINEKDIDKVLYYLRIIRPEMATPETAIRILESMNVIAHRSAVHGEKVDFDKVIDQALQEFDEQS
jgi:hypothetical protein